MTLKHRKIVFGRNIFVSFVTIDVTEVCNLNLSPRKRLLVYFGCARASREEELAEECSFIFLIHNNTVTRYVHFEDGKNLAMPHKARL